MTQHLLLAKKKISAFASVAMVASALLIGSAASAQRPQASPASEASASFSGKTVSVKYGAPSVKGRNIFGDTGRISKDPNYPVWRAGANSATAFHTDADLKVGTIDVPKGDYTLYVDLTDLNKWELIISKQTGQWGLTYKKDMDLGRTKMTMTKPSSLVETLKYTITADGKKGTLKLEWENHAGTVPIEVK